MLQSVYTALSGMRAQQDNIAVIGNNIANINTVGFKSGRTDFAEALYAEIKRSPDTADYQQAGGGIIVGSVFHDQAQGVRTATGANLDFMLDGPGFFTLAGSGGELYYTRNGSFKVSVENGEGYLVNADGLYVVGSDNKPVRVPANASGVVCDASGVLYQDGRAFAALRIVGFTNPAGLLDAGGSKAAATEASGPEQQASGAVVRQGWLEGSNVDLAIEMARLIRAQKAFSVLGAAVRTVSEMESTANNINK